MYHRKPEKYKEFEGMQNAVYGYGELPRVTTSQGVGYRSPCGCIIYDRELAITYAKRLDALIRFNKTRITKQKLQEKPYETNSRRTNKYR